MGGIAPPAAHGKRAAPERAAVGLALQRVTAGEGDQVKISSDKVETGALQPPEPERLRPAVFHNYAARDDITLRQHAVEQRERKPQPLVHQLKGETFRLFLRGIDGGKTAQRVFAGADLVGAIARRAAQSASLIPQAEERAAIIAAAPDRILLRQRVVGIGPVVPGGIGVAGKAAVGIAQKIIHLALAARAVVQMQRHAVGVDLKLIGRVGRMQREELLFG